MPAQSDRLMSRPLQISYKPSASAWLIL